MILCPDDRYLEALIRCDEMMERPSVGLDIYCGRGKGKWNSPGNRQFKQLVHEYLRQYSDAPSKVEKSRIVESVVEAVSKIGGRFLKQDEPPNGPWYEIDPIETRKKVAHAIRDHLATRKKHTRTTSLSKPPHSKKGHGGGIVEELPETLTSEGRFFKNKKLNQFNDDSSGSSSISLLADAGPSRSGADGNTNFIPAFQEESSRRPAFLPAPPALDETTTTPSSTMLLMSRTVDDERTSRCPQLMLQQQQRYNMMALMGLSSGVPNVLRPPSAPGGGALVMTSPPRTQQVQMQMQMQMRHQYIMRPQPLSNISMVQSSSDGARRSVVARNLASQFAGGDHLSGSWPNHQDPSPTEDIPSQQHCNSFNIMDTFNSSLFQRSVGGNYAAAEGSSLQGGGLLPDAEGPLGVLVPREACEGPSRLPFPQQEPDKPSVNPPSAHHVRFPPPLIHPSLQHHQHRLAAKPEQDGLNTRNEGRRRGGVLREEEGVSNSRYRYALPGLPPMSSGGLFESQDSSSPHSHPAATLQRAGQGGAHHDVPPLGLAVSSQERSKTATAGDQDFAPLVARSLPSGVHKQSWDFVGEDFAGDDDDDMNPHSVFPPSK
jgi:hypothetical protein